MACWNKRRWYVENMRGTMVLVQCEVLGICWSIKGGDTPPLLFVSVQFARNAAGEHNGKIRFYDSKTFNKQEIIPF